ncbi:NAD-dependent epimerase/dehydratase family protein [bacterium]|jgi:nucleoside-diphosphate-sugar epimerase|nr:NAD-dependent epimerase/dehydratase family protein [bacterium]
MPTAILTGATGCVGRNILEELLEKKWKVIVLHRRSSDISRISSLPIELAEVNLHNEGSILMKIPSDVDALFHVAGNTSHWSAEAAQQRADNVLATRNLVSVALERKVKKFIFTSTGATLGYQNLDEERAEGIPNNYVKTKYLAELEVHKGIERGLFGVILHPIIVIGPYDYNSYSQIFQSLKKGPMRVAFPGSIAFCHARDVAIAHLQAYESGRNAESYVLGGPYTTWLETFQLICKKLQVPPPQVFSKWKLAMIAYGMDFSSRFTGKKPLLSPELIKLVGPSPDVTPKEKRKAKLELNYESRSLETMVDDCHRWLVHEGLL